MPPCCPTYITVTDDTVASVAAAHSVQPIALVKYNDLPANATMKPGQRLQIPCARIVQYALRHAAAAPAPEPESG